MTDLRLRDAVRAVVVGESGETLLVRFALPGWHGWATPGGGLVPGETDEDALRRELAEETGLTSFELGPLVWTRTHLFEIGDWDGQVERYYLVRVPRFDPLPRLGWDALAREYVTDVRWWGLQELETASDAFAPSRLPLLVHELILHGPPAEAVDAGD